MQSIAWTSVEVAIDSTPDKDVSLGGSVGHTQNRRTFSRTAAGSLIALSTFSCADVAQSGDAATSPEQLSAIALDQFGGDVWAWEKKITGTCSGIAKDAAIELLVNGKPVAAERDGRVFHASVHLRPGVNTVRAVAAQDDGSRRETDEVVYTVKLSPRPTARIAVSVLDNSVIFDGTGSEPSEFDGAAIARFDWTFQPAKIATTAQMATAASPESSLVPRARDDGMLTITVPNADGEYYVSLSISDQQKRVDTATAVFAVKNGFARAVDSIREEAAWSDGASVYGVIVRNFGTGGFQSVTDRLDDLADLGVAALWLAPITETIPDDFGYEVTGYFDVRHEYGTLDDFKRFVQEAHARNIRVLMDFVPNHTSIEHPYFQDVETNGSASPYFDFYDRDASGRYTYYFDWTHLPNLNYENADVRRFMSEAFMFWVREIGVDGFRVDAAWGIEKRRPDFWLEFSAEFNRVKPDGLLVAEASARDPFFVHNGFDSAYDWTNELGIWAWADVFAGVAPIGTGMLGALTNKNGKGYDSDSFIFRFLNNNDTGSRFISIYGIDLYRVASAMLLTLPGLPCVYTGDEVGAEFEPYETTTPIDWLDRHKLRPHFKKLIHLRKEHNGLKSREWTALVVEPVNHLFGYMRHESDRTSPILVMLNFGPEDAEAVVEVSDFIAFSETATLLDLYNDESATIEGGASIGIPIPAWGIRIFQARPSS